MGAKPQIAPIPYLFFLGKEHDPRNNTPNNKHNIFRRIPHDRRHDHVPGRQQDRKRCRYKKSNKKPHRQFLFFPCRYDNGQDDPCCRIHHLSCRKCGHIIPVLIADPHQDSHQDSQSEIYRQEYDQLLFSTPVHCLPSIILFALLAIFHIFFHRFPLQFLFPKFGYRP